MRKDVLNLLYIPLEYSISTELYHISQTPLLKCDFHMESDVYPNQILYAFLSALLKRKKRINQRERRKDSRQKRMILQQRGMKLERETSKTKTARISGRTISTHRQTNIYQIHIYMLKQTNLVPTSHIFILLSDRSGNLNSK